MDFQRKQGLSGQSLPLGFTFSFPCKQLGLDQVRKGEKPSLRAFHPHTLHGVSRRLGSSFQCPGLGGGGADGGTTGLSQRSALISPGVLCLGGWVW